MAQEQRIPAMQNRSRGALYSAIPPHGKKSSNCTFEASSASYATGYVRARRRKTSPLQVFEIAYSRADRFDYRGVPIEGWLIGIARNLVRDHIKKLGRRGIDDEFDDSLELSEPDEADAIGLRHDLLLAMRALTGDQREVLELRFLLDKSVAETAIVMNRSEDAVKNLQRRALAAMQRVLAGEAYPTGGAL